MPNADITTYEAADKKVRALNRRADTLQKLNANNPSNKRIANEYQDACDDLADAIVEWRSALSAFAHDK